MNPTENPRDNVIVRTWAHYNIIAWIFPKSDLTGSSELNWSLNLDKNLPNFFGLWQGRDVTDEKK